MNRWNLMLILYPVLLGFSSYLIMLKKYEIAFVYTIIWVFVYTLTLIRTKINMKQKSENIQIAISRFYNYKRLINALLTIPVMFLIIIVFPFKNEYIYNLIIVHSIFAVITGLHLMNYRINFLDLHHFRGLKFLVPGLVVMGMIAYLNYRFIGNSYISNDVYSWFGIVFVPYVSILYFRGLLQNFMHKIKKPLLTLVYLAIIMSITQLSSGSLILALSVLVSSFFVGYIYFETNNLNLVFLVSVFLNFMQHVYFPIYFG